MVDIARARVTNADVFWAVQTSKLSNLTSEFAPKWGDVSIKANVPFLSTKKSLYKLMN